MKSGGILYVPLIERRFIEINGKKLYRIKALRNFSDVITGELGGFIEGEHNLSTEGDCWVYGYGKVYGNARVSGSAEVYGYARVYGVVLEYLIML